MKARFPQPLADRSALTAPVGGVPAPAPILCGESRSDYEALAARVAEAVRPADFLEEIWLRDVVDLTWEALRLRRLKAALLDAARHEGVKRLLQPLTHWVTAGLLARGFAARDPKAVSEVEALLAKAGLTLEHVTAQTLAANLGHVQQIDAMTAAAEARRNAVLREIDRHRASLAADLRRAAEAIEAAHYANLPRAPPLPLRERSEPERSEGPG